MIEIEDLSDRKSNNNSPIAAVANIGPRLHQILRSNEFPKDNTTIDSNYGGLLDIWPIISSKSGEKELSVKLSYDFWLNKYHIIGFNNNLDYQKHSN